MDEERYPSLPWQGWKIVKRLGRGGFGTVYQAQRNSAGVMEDAAIKVISFPRNKEDIEADITDGYDLVSVRNKYKDISKKIKKEFLRNSYSFIITNKLNIKEKISYLIFLLSPLCYKHIFIRMN